MIIFIYISCLLTISYLTSRRSIAAGTDWWKTARERSFLSSLRQGHFLLPYLTNLTPITRLRKCMRGFFFYWRPVNSGIEIIFSRNGGSSCLRTFMMFYFASARSRCCTSFSSNSSLVDFRRFVSDMFILYESKCNKICARILKCELILFLFYCNQIRLVTELRTLMPANKPQGAMLIVRCWQCEMIHYFLSLLRLRAFSHTLGAC